MSRFTTFIKLENEVFNKLMGEAIDTGEEAMRTFDSLRPEEQTSAAFNSLARALKEADAPVRQYVKNLKIRVKDKKPIERLQPRGPKK